MVFSSTVFSFLFLPVVLIAYFLLRHELRNVWLLLSSLFFYTWGETYLVSVLFVSIGVNYICGLFIAQGFRRGPLVPLERGGQRTLSQKVGLVFSLVANLGLLGVFKYFNFGVASFNTFVTEIGLEQLRYNGLIIAALPLGISFFTFQSMSYTIDVYLGNTVATRNIINFATYVTLFPQLVAGPIVRYKQVAEELVARSITLEKISLGARRFLLGLGKKIILANIVA